MKEPSSLCLMGTTKQQLEMNDVVCMSLPSRAVNVRTFVVDGVEQVDIVMQDHRSAYHLDCNFVIGADVLEQEPAKVHSF
jgi:hypothetical protein